MTTWLSGTWFQLDMIGGAFQSIAQLLPFVHAADAARAVLSGHYEDVLLSLAIVVGYTALTFIIAILVFKGKMQE